VSATEDVTEPLGSVATPACCACATNRGTRPCWRRTCAAPDNVAAVGHSVGYDSPSQFSREYRRAFGSPPGRDAAHLQTVTTLPE
jgi:AraC-like DNA-binding protein